MLSLAALPILAWLSCAYAVRPHRPVEGPLRLAAVRAAILLAAAATLMVEALSAVHAVAVPGVVAGWVVLLAATGAAAAVRYRRDGGRPRPDLRWWREATTPQRVLIVVVAVLLLAELVLAVLSPPNNYDSQTYHLPKIEHWVRQRDVGFFATDIDRQVGLAPGAEYLLLHLRLLTGGDALYNLLQWGAGCGCVLVAARIAGQLGGNRTAQLVSAALVASTPMVALEASSTQTDLVVAFWVGAVATLVLDRPVAARKGYPAAVLIGAGSGLAVLTKAPGAWGVGPLVLLWLVPRLRRVPRDALAGAALAGVVAIAIVGPYLHRTADAYGSPLGPPHQQQLIAMQRHDPAAITVNALRIGYTLAETPIPPLNRAMARAVLTVADAFHVGVSDPAITFFGAAFPAISWRPDEDKAAFPVSAALVLAGAAAVLTRRRTPGPTRAYAAAFWLSVLLHVATVKWQPWGNRLLLYLLVLGAPLAGLYLAAPSLAARPARQRFVAWVAASALALDACSGAVAVGYGWPRRLVGPGSAVATSRLAQRFQRRPQWAADYVWAADRVRAAHARTVGLVQGGDTWEYPWWVLLPPGTDLEALRSTVPGHPPAPVTRMNAVLCVSTDPVCAAYTPPGWSRQVHGIVQVALPPTDPAPAH